VTASGDPAGAPRWQVAGPLPFDGVGLLAASPGSTGGEGGELPGPRRSRTRPHRAHFLPKFGVENGAGTRPPRRDAAVPERVTPTPGTPAHPAAGAFPAPEFPFPGAGFYDATPFHSNGSATSSRRDWPAEGARNRPVVPPAG